MIVSRSQTRLPQHPRLLINGVFFTSVDNSKILGVTLNSKLSFELQHKMMTQWVSSKLSIIRKYKMIYDDNITRNVAFSLCLIFSIILLCCYLLQTRNPRL